MREGAWLIQQSVSLGGRLVYGAIDAALALALWFGVSLVTCPGIYVIVRPRHIPVAPCDWYVMSVLLIWVGLFAMSVVLHHKFGGSVGKLVLGYRTVSLAGERLTWRQAAIRSCALIAMGLLIFLGGSLIAVAIGLCAWASLALGLISATEENRQSELERLLGIVTLRKQDLDAFWAQSQAE
ncbi:MAG: RDD family protein [Rhizobiales bacterium]|nr:RDD family protein [Hyphomicrobiales bacterium]